MLLQHYRAGETYPHRAELSLTDLWGKLSEKSSSFLFPILFSLPLAGIQLGGLFAVVSGGSEGLGGLGLYM